MCYYFARTIKRKQLPNTYDWEVVIFNFIISLFSWVFVIILFSDFCKYKGIHINLPKVPKWL